MASTDIQLSEGVFDHYGTVDRRVSGKSKTTVPACAHRTLIRSSYRRECRRAPEIEKLIDPESNLLGK